MAFRLPAPGRLPLPILACLAGGVAATYLVAWALVMCAPWSYVPSAKRTSASRAWPVQMPASWPKPATHEHADWPGLSYDHWEAADPPVTHDVDFANLPPPPPPRHLYSMTESTCGWPWPCLRAATPREYVLAWSGSTWTQNGHPTSAWVLGIETPFEFMEGRAGPLTNLPIRPKWAPFAFDSLLFAALMGLAWLSLVPVARAVRRRRGRCAGCGYRLTGLPSGAPCPECGQLPRSKPSPVSVG